MSVTPSWPAQADYRDALQTPDLVFQAPDLRTCRVEMNKMGVPRSRSGAFASVYKLTKRNGKELALKLFNFPNGERLGRYDLVSAHLSTLERSKDKPPALVGFQYWSEQIRIGRTWYPAQTMDWVTGEPLGGWVAGRMNAGQARPVRQMADHWVEMIGQLRDAEIAHGDLQHDNVMVARGKPVLVDYDGMWVPKLTGLPMLEFGKPAYQHPRRAELTLCPNLDDFSAWVILIALRASAADPDLYARFVRQENNENILFCEADLKEPKGSKLWPELFKSKDAEVHRWARDLRDCLDGSPDQIPPFTMDATEKIRQLWVAVPKDWEAIAAEGERMDRARQPLPDQPKGLSVGVAEARRRVACRDTIRECFLRGDIRAVARAYSPDVFKGWHAQRGLAKQAEGVAEKVRMLDELKAAHRAPGDGRKLVRLWAAHGPKLGGVREAEAYARAAERWGARITAAEAFLEAHGIPNVTERRLADAWGRVAAAGMHATLLKRDHKRRGELAVERVSALDGLKALPAAMSEENDRALVDAWKPHDALLADCREAQNLRTRKRGAEQRLQAVAAVGVALRRLNRGKGSPEEVTDAAAALPKGYHHSLATQVATAIDGLRLFERLRQALDADPPSDVTIADAWEGLLASGPGRVAGLSPDVVKRCRRAVTRRDAIRSLEEAIEKSRNPYHCDARVLKIWQAHREDLRDCPDAARMFDRIKQAAGRYGKWDKLRRALEAQDLAAVEELAADRELRTYPPFRTAGAEIASLSALAGRLRRVRVCLGEGRLDGEDVEFLRRHHTQLDEKTKRRLVRLARRLLGREAALEEGLPAYEMLPGPLAAARIFWGWSGSGLVSRFVVAINTGWGLTRPGNAPPYTAISYYRPEDYERAKGGVPVVLRPGVLNFVSIWPETDLGWDKVVGPPLVIGPIDADGLGEVG